MNEGSGGLGAVSAGISEPIVDAVENVLEARMIFGGLTPDISGVAFAVSVIKTILIVVGLLVAFVGWKLVKLILAAIAG